ncbi:hypothetical protein TGP89_201210 [Toxoplasma gondii p89]|nr:hypothetical protein TGP89_201210 [Toxoplasma gondii p89]PUA89601.1 hypothetical protein TGBR9_201210 [Toxoplasma gondii TgCATBr9]
MSPAPTASDTRLLSRPPGRARAAGDCGREGGDISPRKGGPLRLSPPASVPKERRRERGAFVLESLSSGQAEIVRNHGRSSSAPNRGGGGCRRHFASASSSAVGYMLLRSVKLNAKHNYAPQIRVEEVPEAEGRSRGDAEPVFSHPSSSASSSPACSSLLSSSAPPCFRMFLDEQPCCTPSGSELLLPSRNLALLVAAEQVALRAELRKRLAVSAEAATQRSEESASSASAASRLPSSLSPSSGRCGEGGEKRDALREQSARLQQFLRERPFALRQPVSSIVFTAVDRIAANRKETVTTLVSLLHSDTALSREEDSDANRASLLSPPERVPPRTQESASPVSSEAALLSSASQFLRDRLSGPWKEEVRRREEDVLEAHVQAFERRRCAGESLHRNSGFSIVHQSDSVVQRLEALYHSCSPFYVAALQVAAMQLRSLILADELLQSVCGEARSSGAAETSHEERTAFAASAAAIPEDNEDLRQNDPDAGLNAKIIHFWKAANIEAEEQQKRFGYVEGVHDVEKAEALLWLHAAALVVKFA